MLSYSIGHYIDCNKPTITTIMVTAHTITEHEYIQQLS
jgi:hypothetical protein